MSAKKAASSVEAQILEERKVKALEKIANATTDLVFWLEEIDKEAWDSRIQYYLAEFLDKTSSDSK